MSINLILCILFFITSCSGAIDFGSDVKSNSDVKSTKDSEIKQPEQPDDEDPNISAPVMVSGAFLTCEFSEIDISFTGTCDVYKDEKNKITPEEILKFDLFKSFGINYWNDTTFKPLAKSDVRFELNSEKTGKTISFKISNPEVTERGYIQLQYLDLYWSELQGSYNKDELVNFPESKQLEPATPDTPVITSVLLYNNDPNIEKSIAFAWEPNGADYYIISYDDGQERKIIDPIKPKISETKKIGRQLITSSPLNNNIELKACNAFGQCSSEAKYKTQVLWKKTQTVVNLTKSESSIIQNGDSYNIELKWDSNKGLKYSMKVHDLTHGKILYEKPLNATEFNYEVKSNANVRFEIIPYNFGGSGNPYLIDFNTGNFEKITTWYGE